MRQALWPVLAALCVLLMSACSTQAVRAVGEHNDPWEEHNRRTHEFNRKLDQRVVRPAAKGYMKVTPEPARAGLRNFFSNLGQPVGAVNKLLQGRPKLAGSAMARFAVNVTLGVGGFLDPATKMDIERVGADMGQTLAGWGWKDSRYMELPLLGPTTVRDTVGLVGDTLVSPLWWLERRTNSYVPFALVALETRAQFIGPDRALRDAVDSYALMRDVYLQRRARIIAGDEEVDLPDYDALLDEEDW